MAAMFSFGGNHYVPRLLWKGGEQAALRQVSATAKGRMTPLIDLVAPPVNKGIPKPAAAHVGDGLDILAKCWAHEAPVFLDPGDSGLSLVALLAAAKARSIRAVPVVRLTSSIADVRVAATHAGHDGIALRIGPSDVAPPGPWTNVFAFLNRHKIPAHHVHLLLDIESLARKARIAISIAWNAVHTLPSTASARFRTMTVLASSFPDLSGTKGLAAYPRNEWLDWYAMFLARGTMPFLPTFGDYNIQAPGGLDGYDPRIMPTSPTVRYTVASEWVVVRGSSSKVSKPGTQFPVLARALVADPRFLGQLHCLGCAAVVRCAAGGAGLGSLTKWREIGATHHLELTTAQIAALPWP